MNVETIKVYKGRSCVKINKCDLEEWQSRGYETSQDRKNKNKSNESTESTESTGDNTSDEKGESE